MVAATPLEQAKQNMKQENSKIWFAMSTLHCSASVRCLFPSGVSHERKGRGAPSNKGISLALDAVPQTGAKCIHASHGESTHCFNKA